MGAKNSPVCFIFEHLSENLPSNNCAHWYEAMTMDLTKAPAFVPSKRHTSAFSKLRSLDLLPAQGLSEEDFWSLFSRCRSCQHFMTTRTIPYHRCPAIRGQQPYNSFTYHFLITFCCLQLTSASKSTRALLNICIFYGYWTPIMLTALRVFRQMFSGQYFTSALSAADI